MMIFKGVQKLTLLDYPGKIACTLFTFGCNFRCPYCHNPELVFNDGTPEIPEEKILSFLEARVGFLEGVCITGGEPTLHDDLPEFIKKVKSFGFFVKLDTNGTNPKMVKELIDKKLVDYIAMDIKAPLEKYDNVVRVKADKKKIDESVKIIKSFPEYEFRTTILPDLLSKQDMIAIAKWLNGAKRFFIQQFKPTKTLEKSFLEKKPYSKEELEEICKAIEPYFGVCKIRNV